MMKSILALSLIANIVLCSLLFKFNRQPVFKHFPVNDINNKCGKSDLCLVVFFSKNTCRDCLTIIRAINDLEKPFSIIGIVPEKEKRDHSELARISNVSLEILGDSNFKKYLPPYAPTIYGITGKGTILFIIPSFKLKDELVAQFILQFYDKSYPLIVE